jgi:Apea-like HEPN
MTEKTRIMDLISPNWFKDVNKSSIWIVGYRMMQVTQEDFIQSQPMQSIIDLGEVRVIFNYGSLTYMDASNIFDFGQDHARRSDYSKFESKETNIGGWTILITPYVCDGVQRSELEIRNSIIVAEGILSALNSSNMVYEKVYENIVELSPIKTTAFSPTFLTSYRPPNLQAPALQLLSHASVNMQALPENVRNRVELSLRWYSKSLVQGLDGFLSIWISIEVIGMPDTSDVKPAVQSLAQIYQVDYQTAKDRFQLGRIHGFRSKIVHNGKMFPIHFLLISYLQAIYVDLLAETLKLPHERRAETVLDDPQFNLGKFINQS